jgi:hypothetical protein
MIAGCLPAVAGSALFIALLIMDVVNRDYERLPGHILVGLFAIVLFLFLCERGMNIAGWAIFSIPFVLVGLGWATAEIRKA